MTAISLKLMILSILCCALQNTKGVEGNIRHYVYLLENAILNLPEGQEQMIWLIDFSDVSMRTYISVRLAQEIIHVLQNHYPGRLTVAFLYNPPKIFEAFGRFVNRSHRICIAVTSCMLAWRFV
uniref:CRAL-TRIO domain-containing protein n=1 Tax=Opuntia streptacantha TaxID=393608 RepID=A0A7C8YDQ2_OPUST